MLNKWQSFLNHHNKFLALHILSEFQFFNNHTNKINQSTDQINQNVIFCQIAQCGRAPAIQQEGLMLDSKVMSL